MLDQSKVCDRSFRIALVKLEKLLSRVLRRRAIRNIEELFVVWVGLNEPRRVASNSKWILCAADESFIKLLGAEIFPLVVEGYH